MWQEIKNKKKGKQIFGVIAVENKAMHTINRIKAIKRDIRCEVIGMGLIEN